LNRWVLSPARNCPRLLFTMADHRLVNNTRITDSSQATASGSSTIWTSGPATRILSSETSAMARFSLDMRELKTINALGTLGVVSETQWLSTQAIYLDAKFHHPSLGASPPPRCAIPYLPASRTLVIIKTAKRK